MKTKYENPLCYAVYEYNRLCQACYKNEHGVYECTGLSDTDKYMEGCPFFVPLCEHRINNPDGFRRCDIIGDYCDGGECKFYKAKGEEI